MSPSGSYSYNGSGDRIYDDPNQSIVFSSNPGSYTGDHQYADMVYQQGDQRIQPGSMVQTGPGVGHVQQMPGGGRSPVDTYRNAQGSASGSGSSMSSMTSMPAFGGMPNMGGMGIPAMPSNVGGAAYGSWRGSQGIGAGIWDKGMNQARDIRMGDQMFTSDLQMRQQAAQAAYAMQMAQMQARIQQQTMAAQQQWQAQEAEKARNNELLMQRRGFINQDYEGAASTYRNYGIRMDNSY